MKKLNKKGFTIVELVIVIAVIAILAAVLIPTFSGVIAKANLSADQQAITNMNKYAALGNAESKFENPSDVVKAMYSYGFNDGKMETYSDGFNYVYNFEENKMYLVDDEDKVVYPDADVDKNKLWGFYYNAAESKIGGITNYIAMANVTNAANFDQAFGDGAEYQIDLNNYYIALGEYENAKVNVFNGGFVSGNVGKDENVKTYEVATSLTAGASYSYTVFQNVMDHSGKTNMTFENCVFYDSSFKLEKDITSKNCTFIGGIAGNASLELYANQAGEFDILIEDCTFNNVARPINITNATVDNKRDITIKGCEFNGTTDPKYLIQVAWEDITLTVENCKFNSLGAASGIIRLHESLVNKADFDYEDFVDNKLTVKNNTISDSIPESKYIDVDELTTDRAVAIDNYATSKFNK